MGHTFRWVTLVMSRSTHNICDSGRRRRFWYATLTLSIALCSYNSIDRCCKVNFNVILVVPMQFGYIVKWTSFAAIVQHNRQFIFSVRQWSSQVSSYICQLKQGCILVIGLFVSQVQLYVQFLPGCTCHLFCLCVSPFHLVFLWLINDWLIDQP